MGPLMLSSSAVGRAAVRLKRQVKKMKTVVRNFIVKFCRKWKSIWIVMSV